MEKNYYELYYRAQEGLLGAITPVMRGISIRTEDDIFYVNVYMEREPNQMEIELVQDFADHVCINIPWLSVRKQEINFKVTDTPLDEIEDNLKTWVYIRYEKKVAL